MTGPEGRPPVEPTSAGADRTWESLGITAEDVGWIMGPDGRPPVEPISTAGGEAGGNASGVLDCTAGGVG
jgi:hypothetical protein